MEGDIVTLSDIYSFDHSMGIGLDGRVRGQIRPTGIRPTFSDALASMGIPLPAGMFGDTDLFLAGRR